MFGLVGFAIGLTVYAGFEIATGIFIGYLALAVGWIIGKAMMMGSKGIGGRRYQFTAVFLTYAAVLMAFIPLAFSLIAKKKAQSQHISRQAPAGPASGESNAPPPQEQRSNQARRQRAPISPLLEISLSP